jgi:hypothetical protein
MIVALGQTRTRVQVVVVARTTQTSVSRQISVSGGDDAQDNQPDPGSILTSLHVQKRPWCVAKRRHLVGQFGVALTVLDSARQ